MFFILVFTAGASYVVSWHDGALVQERLFYHEEEFDVPRGHFCFLVNTSDRLHARWNSVNSLELEREILLSYFQW